MDFYEGQNYADPKSITVKLTYVIRLMYLDLYLITPEAEAA